MAVKQYYHDLDLVKVGQLVNARLHNVTDTEMTALAATLDASNTGLIVYNTTQKQQFNWDGATFVPLQIDMTGDIVFKGVIADPTNADASVQKVSGYQYVVGTGGSLSLTGVTIVGGDTNNDGTVTVEAGDQVLFVDVGGTGADVPGTQSTVANTAYVIQRNVEQATENTLGTVRLATQEEANAGTVDNEAITPKTLEGKLNSAKFTKQYFASVNLAIATPFTVTHNLGLEDRDAFTINTMLGNSQISLDVDSVDANSITLTSLVPLSNVKVTIIGSAAVV